MSPDVTGATCHCSKFETLPPERPPEPCNNFGIEAQCSHGRQAKSQLESSGFVSALVVADPMAFTPYLEVVAGPKKKGDKVTFKTTVTEGPCGYHAMKVFDWASQPTFEAKEEVSRSDTQLVLDMHSEPIDWDNVMGYFWLPWAPRRKYNVNANTCNHSTSLVRVDVLPDIEWNVSLTFSLDTALFYKHVQNNDEKRVDLNVQQGTSVFQIIPDVKWVYDGETRSLGPKFQKSLEESLSVLNWAISKLRSITDELYLKTGTRIKFRHQTKLEGDWKWKEIPGSNLAGLECSATLTFDPLIEITLTQNITKAILVFLQGTAAAPVAIPLNKAYTAMERRKLNYEAKDTARGKKRFDADGYVTGGVFLIFTGGLGLVGTYQKKAEKKEWTLDGHGTGAVSMTLKATIEGKLKGRVYRFQTTASGILSISGKAGIKLDKVKPVNRDNDLYLGLVLIFTGLEINGVGNVELDAGFVSNEEQPKPTPTYIPTFSGEFEENDDNTNIESGLGKLAVSNTVSDKKKTADGMEYVESEDKTEGDIETTQSSIKAKGGKSFKKTLIEPRVWNHTGKVYDKAPDATPEDPFRIINRTPK